LLNDSDNVICFDKHLEFEHLGHCCRMLERHIIIVFCLTGD